MCRLSMRKASFCSLSDDVFEAALYLWSAMYMRMKMLRFLCSLCLPLFMVKHDVSSHCGALCTSEMILAF